MAVSTAASSATCNLNHTSNFLSSKPHFSFISGSSRNFPTHFWFISGSSRSFISGSFLVHPACAYDKAAREFRRGKAKTNFPTPTELHLDAVNIANMNNAAKLAATTNIRRALTCSSNFFFFIFQFFKTLTNFCQFSHYLSLKIPNLSHEESKTMATDGAADRRRPPPQTLSAGNNGNCMMSLSNRLRLMPNKDHKAESYEDLEQLEFSRLLFSSLERYLPPTMLNASRDLKLQYMRDILLRYSPESERTRVQRHREYRQKIITHYQVSARYLVMPLVSPAGLPELSSEMSQRGGLH